MNKETEPRESKTERTTTPRIDVASLADHNAGRLHGVWLEAAQEPDELAIGISSMLARSREPYAEEWAIHDYEGFDGLSLGEWESLDRISRIANGIAENGPAFAHWASLGMDEEQESFEHSYLGHWGSVTEYAENVLEDLGLYEQVEQCVPENLRPYVVLDASGFGRDLQVGGDIMTADAEEGGVYVLSSLTGIFQSGGQNYNALPLHS